jgi:2-dehydro-3-deoxyphosphooctonate aldolase (KDO 8-P synthase)
VFLEVHPDPPRARCDASSQLPLARFAGLLEQLVALRQLHNSWEDGAS